MLVTILSGETGIFLWSESKIKSVQERKLSLVVPICIRDWEKGRKEHLVSSFAADTIHALPMLLGSHIAVFLGQLSSGSISICVRALPFHSKP